MKAGCEKKGNLDAGELFPVTDRPANMRTVLLKTKREQVAVFGLQAFAVVHAAVDDLETERLMNPLRMKIIDPGV